MSVLSDSNDEEDDECADGGGGGGGGVDGGGIDGGLLDDERRGVPDKPSSTGAEGVMVGVSMLLLFSLL